LVAYLRLGVFLTKRSGTFRAPSFGNVPHIRKFKLTGEIIGSESDTYPNRKVVVWVVRVWDELDRRGAIKSTVMAYLTDDGLTTFKGNANHIDEFCLAVSDSKSNSLFQSVPVFRASAF
jgi:hypothetical protein